MSVTVYLGLGSNLGDRMEHLCEAVRLLAPAVVVTGVSSVYETDPVGFTGQPAFLNVAVRGETDFTPTDLLALCKRIEAERQRVATVRWGPRTCDVDILLYGDLAMLTPDLTIPHARLHERAFVLVPLAEIAPEARHPLRNRTVAQMAASVEGREGVRRLAEGRVTWPADGLPGG